MYAALGCFSPLADPMLLLAQAQTADRLDSKAFEAGVSYSQSLTQLALLVVVGTLAVLLGTSYRRPANRFIRYAYFMFIPGWAGLALSIYCGGLVQRSYLGYLWRPKADPAKVLQTMNADAYCQLSSMEWSLAIFGVWLVVYLLWWILHQQLDGSTEN